MFSVHRSTLPNKVKQIQWQTVIPASRLGRQAYFGALIWKIYGIPACLHGCEAIRFTAQNFSALEVSQNNILHNLLGVPQCTPIQALYGECGVYSIRIEILKRQLNYVNYLSTLPDSRLVKQAYLCQQGVLGARNNSWLTSIRQFALELGFQDITWFPKLVVKRVILRHTQSLFLNGVQNTRCLRYYFDKLSPLRDRDLICKTSYEWWVRARIGSLFLSERCATRPPCPLCLDNASETLEHFLFKCPELIAIDWGELFAEDINIDQYTGEELCSFVLSIHRTLFEKQVAGGIIQARWEQ